MQHLTVSGCLYNSITTKIKSICVQLDSECGRVNPAVECVICDPLRAEFERKPLSPISNKKKKRLTKAFKSCFLSLFWNTGNSFTKSDYNDRQRLSKATDKGHSHLNLGLAASKHIDYCWSTFAPLFACLLAGLQYFCSVSPVLEVANHVETNQTISFGKKKEKHTLGEIQNHSIF